MYEIGPYVIMTHEEGDYELGLEEIMKKIAVAKGIPLNEIVLAAIKKIAKEDAEEAKEQLRSQGFPPNIKTLFDAENKKDLIRIADKMMVSGDDIARMVFNHAAAGFTHTRKHKWFHPEDLLHTKEEFEAFSEIEQVGPITDKRALKFLKKTQEMLAKRKYISAHLLEKGDEWHIFYFDFNDRYAPQGQNHYQHGPHVHYISHLWGKQTDKNLIWQELENRQTKIASIHIQYNDQRE